MQILKERTRLLITEFTSLERKRIEDKVASLDNIYLYYDPDKNSIGLPTGMEKSLRQDFPKARFIDHSSEYWDYAKIQPIEHNAQPRNQLQIDFINFVLENAKKKQKLAGILSPGTGKANPLSTSIPTPIGSTTMGDIQRGDIILSYKGRPTTVTDIYPQGVKDVYELTFEDGRTSRCTLEHMWRYKMIHNQKIFTSNGSLSDIIKFFNGNNEIYIPSYDGINYNNETWIKLVSIKQDGQEECQCIMVDDPTHLYLCDDYIVTHNTFMACYSSINVGLRTLIIVPTSGIKVQWADTLTGMFNVPEERVNVVSKPSDFINVKKDFTIVTHATLSSLNKKYRLDDIMRNNKFGIKVVDEVQMYFKNLVMIDASSNIANNWYLTGTFGRSGETENKIYQEMFGDLEIFREKDKKPTLLNRKPGNIYGMKPHMYVTMIWGHSKLSKEEIKSVTNSMRYSEREEKWIRYGISVPNYMNLIIPPDGSMTPFLRLILDTVKKAEHQVTYGRTLILGSTITTAEIVAGYVQKMFPKKVVRTYHSHHSKDENEKYKSECDILVSTISSAGTGFDMKDLSKLIVYTSFKSWILADQVSGRLRRRPDGKATYMWDIVDADIKQLRVWANARADVYRRKSKKFTVVDG